jgi:hypothetical protein
VIFGLEPSRVDPIPFRGEDVGLSIDRVRPFLSALVNGGPPGLHMSGPTCRLTFLSQVMLDVRARKRMGPRVPRGLVVDLGLLSSGELGWRVEGGRPWPAVDPAARVDRGSGVKGRP